MDILISKFPLIKISLFTTPLLNNLPLFNDEKFIEKIKFYINSNNIRLAVHGLKHDMEEFKFLDKKEATNRLLTAQSIFEHCNLNYAKVFRGPNWGVNENTIEALNDLQYTHFYNHENYKHLENKFNGKVVYYNWNLKDEASEENTLIAHGHTHNVCDNGISQVLPKIIKFIQNNNLEFKFVDEI